MAKRPAPRSLNQFKIGPPFSSTNSLLHIYSLNGTIVKPVINARSDRGFDIEGDTWIGYKRNYFALVACFHFSGLPVTICSSESFYIKDRHEQKHQVTCFKLGLFDYSFDMGESGKFLVQHTSKRDKGPQFLPPVYNIVPGALPLHGFMKLIANVRNPERVHECYEQFFLTKEEKESFSEDSVMAKYPPGAQIARVARYERMQFLNPNKHFVLGTNRQFLLVIRLICELENGDSVIAATTETPCLNIRGRSPVNYAMEEQENKENVNKRKAPAGSYNPSSKKTARLNPANSPFGTRPWCSAKSSSSLYCPELVSPIRLNSSRDQDEAPKRQLFKGKPTAKKNDASSNKQGETSTFKRASSRGFETNIDTGLLSSPVESLTPRCSHIVTLKFRSTALRDTLSSEHLQPHDPAKVTLDIAGSPMTSMPSTPECTISRTSEIDESHHDSISASLEEYRKAHLELKLLASELDYGLDLPVPLTIFPLLIKRASSKKGFFRLPPAEMQQPQRLCKHGCKMREDEVPSNGAHRKATKTQDLALELTSFFENNSDSSLLRFQNLLSKIKADIDPSGSLSPLSDISSPYSGPLW